MGLFSSFTRLWNGDVHYHQIGSQNPLWSDLSQKIKVSKENPVLLPAIQLIADYFSSAEFYEKDGDELRKDTKILKVLENPNPRAQPETMALGFFFNLWKQPFNQTCILDKCTNVNGGEIKMYVNGKENTLFEDYVFELGARFPTSFDGDEYFLTFKNKKKHPDKMEMKKYDPVVRQHVMYKEGKIK